MNEYNQYYITLHVFLALYLHEIGASLSLGRGGCMGCF